MCKENDALFFIHHIVLSPFHESNNSLTAFHYSDFITPHHFQEKLALFDFISLFLPIKQILICLFVSLTYHQDSI